MTVIAEFTLTAPAHIRRALSRGLAKDAFAMAQADDGDMAALLVTSSTMTKNLANRRRTAARMMRLPGVVRVSKFGEGLSAVLRTRREMILRDTQGEQFREQTLMYTRVTFLRTGRGMDFTMKRVSFSQHALERLVQRSDCPLEGMLGQIDAEALAILGATWPVPNEERSWHEATRDGVWAGHHDHSLAADHWPLNYRTEEDRRIPTFSVRTFLSPDEMNPVVWLGWQGDDSIAIAS